MKAFSDCRDQNDGLEMVTELGGACQQVFQVPELFDLIMLQLDQQALLTGAQRVCRTWKTLIDESSILQRALFYRADDSKNLPKKQDQRCWPFRNPLLAQRFNGWFVTHNITSCCGYLPSKTQFHNQPFHNGYSSQLSASWRNMLVQQNPVIRKIGMLWLTGDHKGNYWVTAKLFSCTSRGGLRMGDYYDMAALQENDRDFPAVFWPTHEMVENATRGKVDARETFLQCMQNHYMPPDHPRRLEVEEHRRKIVFEADMTFVMPFDVCETPRAKKKESNERFYKKQRAIPNKGWDLAPLRGGFMSEFQGIDGTMGDRVKFGLQEVYTWRAQIEGGVDVHAWGAAMHSTIFD